MSSFIFNLLITAGSLVFVYIYGILGTLLTVLLFFKVGPTKFFRRVQRPEIPIQALDPTYGKHNMITLKSSGEKLHYVSKGSSDQPLMLFVHGFPECWYTWRYQMTHFSSNYRVVAIDQRGYGLSSKPSQVKDYKVDILARDIADVIEQLGYQSCVLVGHDWGGVVAWATAIQYPRLVDKLIILNCPHPAAFLSAMSFAQLRRSWYIFFYQIPFIPELLVQANDFALLRRAFLEPPMGLANPKNMTNEDLDVFKYTFSQPGTATAAINYYRALLRYRRDDSKSRINRPVLIVWGCQDKALGEELADASKSYCSNVQLKKIKHASHWVQQDEPEVVNQFIEAFLNEK